MNQLKFAIVGCGRIAPKHAEEMVKQGRLIAVCDTVQEKADKFAGNYQCRAYYSLDDLLLQEKPDILAVCTPNGLHTTHSIAGLKSGANVLCEKPLCISTADAAMMMATAEKTGKKLFVVKSTRYNPALTALREHIRENRLGKLYSFQLNCFWNRPDKYYENSWKGNLELDGGSLYTQFSHYIDALLWIAGEIKEVAGFRKNLAHQSSIEFEDSGVVAVEMKNGMIGSINWSVNTFEKNMEVSLTIIGEKGTIRIAGEYMNRVDYQTGSKIAEVSDSGNANDYGFYKGSMSNHDKVYENLVKAINDEQHPFANATDGLKTVAAIERIYQSVRLT